MGQMFESGPVHAGQQTARVGIAQIALLARHRVQPGDHRLGDAARAIAAAGEPDGVDARIIGELDKGLGPRPVVPREVTVLQEAGGVEDHSHVAIRVMFGHPLFDGLGPLL